MTTETEQKTVAIAFEMPADYMWKIGVDKKAVTFDLATMDETWFKAIFMYGLRRKPNDATAKSDAEHKFADFKKYVEGFKEEFTGRANAAVTRSTDPIGDHILKAAKAHLVAAFKKAGFGKKVAEFATHEKAGKFFTKDVWNDEVVRKWADGMDAKSKTSFMADAIAAQALLEEIDDGLFDIDDEA